MRATAWRWLAAACAFVPAWLGAAQAAREASAVQESSLALPPARERAGLRWFAPERREAQAEYEAALNASVDPARLRAWHELLAEHPHIAGTPGDLKQIEKIARAFGEMGLEVETHWFVAYLAHPVSAEVEIVAPEASRKQLPVTEPRLKDDRFSAHVDLTIGWNAYSGSGEAVGEVVYANYGRKEDFEALKELGIDLTGKIVIARYGGNFRGFKAKFAEQAGAAALIIYTEPADSGYLKGLMYPEGGWANPHQIQRGSVNVLEAVGDPLTPGWEATEDCERLDPEKAGLPKIPVQPIGWAAAQEIMGLMRGPAVAEHKQLGAAWQGGMPFAYRVTGGKDLKVRVKVEQKRGLFRTANVIGTLKGATFPDEYVIAGAHHDAWGFGACDPTCGTILVMESARVFAEQAKAGKRPARSIKFATWGAEEYGIIGSTEWVESRTEELGERCMGYINLDMATMGPSFGSSTTPTLKGLVMDAAREVPQCGAPGLSVYEDWAARGSTGRRRDVESASGGSDRAGGAVRGGARAGEPRVGDLGGGSDHVGFVCRAGVPSMSMGSGGASGTSYHSNYDNLYWYWLVVGEDYEPAAMNTRMVNLALARIANADVLPYEPARYGQDFVRAADMIAERAGELGVAWDGAALKSAAEEFGAAAEEATAEVLRQLEGGSLGEDGAGEWNRRVRGFDRCLIAVEEGLPGRTWYRNFFVSPNPWSGYDSWLLPALRRAVEAKDAEGAEHEARRLIGALASMRQALVEGGSRGGGEATDQ